MNSPKKNYICVIAQFPPPVHGLSKAVDTLYSSSLFTKYNFSGINITDNKKFIRNIFKILQNRSDVFYLTISQSKGGNVRDLIIIGLLKLCHKKVIIHLHGGYFRNLFENEFTKLQKKINIFTLSKVDAAIVLGESLKGIFQGLVPEKKIFVVHNCVDDKYLLSENEFIQKMKSLREVKEINILYLSNFIESKGYKEVLDLALLCKKNHFINVKFYFAGKFFTNDDNNYFRRFVEQNELSSIVYYKGIVSGDEKRKLLQQSHVFILPTRYPKEGQPISIIEALGNGLLVITTNYAGIPDLIRNGENGILIDYHDCQGMYDVIKMLYDNNDVFRNMCISGRKTVINEFRESNYINGLDNVFQEVIDNGRLKQI